MLPPRETRAILREGIPVVLPLNQLGIIHYLCLSALVCDVLCLINCTTPFGEFS